MSLYFQIKKLYPDIKNNEFMIQNDGNGAYIKIWNSSYSKPTQLELNSVYLQSLKEEKIEDLKSISLRLGYLKAPIFKQLNIGLGIYNNIESAPIINWIKAVRQAVQEIENKINMALTIEEIESIIYTYESLKARIEIIYKAL